MERKKLGKKEFVLDCCNKAHSQLKRYESDKDLFLTGYFAMKSRRNFKMQRNQKDPKFDCKGTKMPSAYFSIPHLSPISPSVPLSSAKKSSAHSLSPKEFQALISKYRTFKVPNKLLE